MTTSSARRLQPHHRSGASLASAVVVTVMATLCWAGLHRVSGSATTLSALAAVAGAALAVSAVLAGNLAGDLRARRAAAAAHCPVTAEGSVVADFQAAARTALASDSALACVVLEVDHFEQYAASHGGAAGEVLLDTVGDIVRDAIRASDTAYRASETRFVLALPDTPAAAATRLAERIRESIVRALLSEGVTVSGGVAGLPTHATDAEDLVAAATAALAEAQRHGRNQVRVASATFDEVVAARANVGRR